MWTHLYATNFSGLQFRSYSSAGIFSYETLCFSKEPGVQSYIGNMLFNYPDSEVDFYLPQLVCMYLAMPDVAEVIHPYLVHRCRASTDFALKCAWLLDAYSADSQLPSKRKSHGAKLRGKILSDQLRPRGKAEEVLAPPPPPPPPLPSHLLVQPFKAHHRSKSDASGLIQSNQGRKITTFGKF